MSDLMRRGGVGEFEMLAPRRRRVVEKGRAIGAVEHVARARCVHDFFGRHMQRRQVLRVSIQVVPEESLFAIGDAADAAPLLLEKGQHLQFRQRHLPAQVLRDDRHVDKVQQLQQTGTQGAAVERHQHALLARGLGVIERGVAHMAVEVQQFRARKIEARATGISRSGDWPSLAQAKAAVAELPPKDTA